MRDKPREEDGERDKDEGTDKGSLQSLFWTPGVDTVYLMRGNNYMSERRPANGAPTRG